MPNNEHDRSFDNAHARGGGGDGSTIVLPTATLANMIFRIAAELGGRFDLAGAIGSATQQTPNSEAIRNAINTAITVYQKSRFRFNEMDPSNPGTFNTNPQQSVYTAADNPVISSNYFIDYLNLNVGNTLLQLDQVSPERQHLNIQLFIQYGMPTTWAYEGNSIILYPIPVATYPIYIGAHLLLPGPTSDTDNTNVWMQPHQGERLIRCRAKYEIATHVTRNAAMQASLSPFPDGNNGTAGETYRAFQALKAEGNKITSTRSRMIPMAF